MFFIFRENLIIGAVVSELLAPAYNHDSGGEKRHLAFIRLCYQTVSGLDSVADPRALARAIDCTPKQAGIMWDILVKRGVLRRGPSGYSIKEWMKEQCLIGRLDRENRTESVGKTDF